MSELRKAIKAWTYMDNNLGITFFDASEKYKVDIVKIYMLQVMSNYYCDRKYIYDKILKTIYNDNKASPIKLRWIDHNVNSVYDIYNRFISYHNVTPSHHSVSRLADDITAQTNLLSHYNYINDDRFSLTSTDDKLLHYNNVLDKMITKEEYA